MAWTRSQGANTYNTTAGGTSTAVALGASVAVGDTINVGMIVDNGGGATGAVCTDSLGNTYTQKCSGSNGTTLIRSFFCVVTTAGTPTVTIQYNPTPGTTPSDACELCVDHLTGSDAASTTEGTPGSNVQAAPGTGTDAVTVSVGTTTTNGCLIWSMTYGKGSIGFPPTAGTGYTLGTTGTDALATEYKTLATAGAASATYTVNPGSGTTISQGFAVKPAATGAVIPVFMNQYRQRGN